MSEYEALTITCPFAILHTLAAKRDNQGTSNWTGGTEGTHHHGRNVPTTASSEGML